MKTLTVLVFLLATSGCASADEDLSGAYERVSLTNTRTGDSPEAANRKGLLILAHGHYSMMTMNPDRRVISKDDIATMTTEVELAYLREWLDINGHTGRYAVEDDTLIWHRDISEDPKEAGTESRLKFEWRDEQLVIYFTLPNGDRYDWIWKKLHQRTSD